MLISHFKWPLEMTMSTLIKDESKDDGLFWYSVPRYLKQDYLALVGKAGTKEVLEDFNSRCEEVNTILFALGYRSVRLDTSVYEGIARYAFEGDCSFPLSLKDEGETLFEHFGRVIGMMELFQCFEEYIEGPGIGPHLGLMLNTLYARIKIDQSRLLNKDDEALSLIEVSLLSGMKEGSVRNCAVAGNPHFLRTKSFESGATYVNSLEAHTWLCNRRKYKPSTLPLKPAERQKLLKYLQYMFYW